MTTYSVLVHQRLAVEVDASVEQPFPLFSDAARPVAVVRPVHEDEANRVAHGGTRIGVEFDSGEEDLVRAMAEGMLLVDDLTASVGLVAGVPFMSATPLQIVRQGPGPKWRFLLFLPFRGWAWPDPITRTTLDYAGRMQAHWSKLERGDRLRRAARHYRHALSRSDPVDVFLHAYAGLEALEHPLAGEAGIPPGHEMRVATCPHCGKSWEYKATFTAGVRAFVTGSLHGETSTARSKEWRALNDLRNSLLHGRGDLDALLAQAKALMTAACHYLHDASVHLAHQHQLEDDEFSLSRFGKWFVVRGEATLDVMPSLLDQTLFLEAEDLRWVSHPDLGVVPEYALANASGGTVEAEPCLLDGGIDDASEDDLVSIRWEGADALEEESS